MSVVLEQTTGWPPEAARPYTLGTGGDRPGTPGWSDDLSAFAHEETGPAYFIDRASREHAARQLARHAPADALTLDVGCSTGRTLHFLRERLPLLRLLGSEYVWHTLRDLARSEPDVGLVQLDLGRVPFDGTLDAILLLNVLEHLDDDLGALRQVWQALRPGGIAVIEVPAGPHLYDVYDRFLQHRRRYALAQVASLAEQAGFTVIERSHLGCFVYPGFALVKRRNRRRTESHAADRGRVSREIRRTRGNPLLDLATTIELALGRRVSYPFGVRCVVTCARPYDNPDTPTTRTVRGQHPSPEVHASSLTGGAAAGRAQRAPGAHP
jgi:SAM-dependent methyltransferase